MRFKRPPIYVAIDGKEFNNPKECLEYEASLDYCPENVPLRFDVTYKETKTFDNPKYIVCFTAKQVRYAMLAWGVPQPSAMKDGDEQFDKEEIAVFMYEAFKDGDAYIEINDYILDIQGEIDALEDTISDWKKQQEEYNIIVSDLEMVAEEIKRKNERKKELEQKTNGEDTGVQMTITDILPEPTATDEEPLPFE